jgi:hypothetical protein
VWFRGYDWETLTSKRTKSAFIPPKEDNFDAKYTNSEWKDNNTEQMR